MRHPLTLVRTLTMLSLSFGSGEVLMAHDLRNGDDPHPHYDWSVKPPENVQAPVWFVAQADTSPLKDARPSANKVVQPKPPAQAASFLAFAPKVRLRWDADFLYVESNGMPSHPMMIGITNWQQQVPLPHAYTGANAWQIPLHPVVAVTPLSIKGRFLRGAIALAANGIPIFNPQNNRGEIAQEIGELDQWGGHCGRADDYHYHAAPLHLQLAVGKGMPIAYALDGYPIYGLTEPDGTALKKLDAFNGHDDARIGYHYHASTKYPYVNGGFHGEVNEVGGQVDPQPSAGGGVRGAGSPLRGAKITGFEIANENHYKLSYEASGDKRAVLYTINADGTFLFEYQNGRDGTSKETYQQRGQGGIRPGPEREGRGADREGPPPHNNNPDEERPEPVSSESLSIIGMDEMKKPNKTFVLTSSEVKDGGTLPVEFTGDGSGATPPLAWKGAPAGTQSYALVMDHLAPGDEVKSYWTLWDIPSTTSSLPKNVKGIGKMGTSFRGMLGYQPPHSKGPGAKTYVITIYALSAPVHLSQSPYDVTREILLTAIKDKVLASASLSVVYSREGNGSAPPEDRGRQPR